VLIAIEACAKDTNPAPGDAPSARALWGRPEQRSGAGGQRLMRVLRLVDALSSALLQEIHYRSGDQHEINFPNPARLWNQTQQKSLRGR
jgi:hypothetical protein